MWGGVQLNKRRTHTFCTSVLHFASTESNKWISIVVVDLDYHMHAFLLFLEVKTCLAAPARSSDYCFVQIGSGTGRESWTSHHKLRQQVKTSPKPEWAETLTQIRALFFCKKTNPSFPPFSAIIWLPSEVQPGILRHGREIKEVLPCLTMPVNKAKANCLGRVWSNWMPSLGM